MVVARLLTLTTIVAVLVGPGSPTGQEKTNADYMRERKTMIRKNINLALPAARRGLELLLAAAGGEEQILRASDALFTSYRHLRSAQESSETVMENSKFPDPLMKLRNARIQKIRDQLRFCHDNDGLLVKHDQQVLDECLRGLVEAVRSLEFVVTTMN